MIKKYKDNSGGVHEINESHRQLLPVDAVEISEAEAIILITPSPPSAAELTAQNNALVEANLTQLDLKSIRAMREYIASKADAPQILKDRESTAQAERAKRK